VNNVSTKPRAPRGPKGHPGNRVKYKAGTRVRAGRSGRGFWIVVVVVVVIGIAAVTAIASGTKTGVTDPAASAALVTSVTSVPATVFDRVGAGTATAAPKKLSAPALTQGGKPRIVYIGAESCPYCATERWAIVAALSRFGTFSGLETTHSSTLDVFPGTQTLSFHGSTYKSAYAVFTPVETTTNKVQGNGYAPLDTPTAEESQLLTTYDVPPYSGADSSSIGAIPFLYFAGKYISVGATYDPTVLQGKSATAIAAALSDPTSTISQGAIGAANGLTAAICSITGNQPGSVCSDPMIRRIESALA
jgi:hypothetical protein